MQITYKEALKRRADILSMRAKGLSLAEIAKHYPITRERVRQIILKEPKDMSAVKLHPAFVGEPEWRQMGRERIRHLVRYRDGFRCQSCKRKWRRGMRQFDVHHLNGQCGKKTKKYDRKSDMAGLITLCHGCHYHHPEHSQKYRRR